MARSKAKPKPKPRAKAKAKAKKQQIDLDDPSIEDVEQLLADGDFETAADAAYELTFDADTLFDGMRLLALAKLSKHDLDSARELYESLNDDFWYAANDPLAAVRRELETSKVAGARDMLAYLQPRSFEPRSAETFWSSLPADLRPAVEKAVADAPADRKAAAAFGQRSLRIDREVKSIAALAQMPLLRSLRVDAPIPFAELRAFGKLEDLRFAEVGLADTSFAAAMPELRKFIVFGNDTVTDVSSLANASKLEFLQLAYGQVRDLGFLRDKPKLTYLSVTVADGVTDLSLLSKLVTLEWLNLFSNSIESLEALAPLAKLEQGDFKPRPFVTKPAKLRTLAGLEGKPLRNIDIGPAVELRDISALAGAGATLKYLIIDDAAKVTDFSPLGNLPNLEQLDLNGARGLRDLAVLGAKPKLTKLDISGTGVSDLSPLAKFPALHELECYHPAGKLRGIGKLLALHELKLDPRDFEGAEAKQLTKALERLHPAGE